LIGPKWPLVWAECHAVRQVIEAPQPGGPLGLIWMTGEIPPNRMQRMVSSILLKHLLLGVDHLARASAGRVIMRVSLVAVGGNPDRPGWALSKRAKRMTSRRLAVWAYCATPLGPARSSSRWAGLGAWFGYARRVGCS
jgi:hypothetical protein